MAGSKKGDKNNGRFSKENQPMRDESVQLKNAVSHAVTNTFYKETSRIPNANKHIKEDILKYIGDAILEHKKDKKSFIEQFVDTSLETARKDPRSKQAEKFLNILFREDLLDQLQELYNKKEAQEIEYTIYKIRKQLYDKQQEVFDTLTNNIENKILIINSRRSGKTELLGRLAAAELVSNQDAHVVYINRSSSTAIRQIRGPLNTALEATDLIITKGSIDNQELHVDRGGQMLIIGNNNKADIDKMRGERISLCILDECGHQRNMSNLVREVLLPAMMDYGKEAKLVLVGTPPRNPHTYIEDVWEHAVERGWKVFHWTFEDNPFIKDKELALDEVCKANGVDRDSAFIQREYFGRMGVYDDEAVVWRKYSKIDKIEASNASKTFTHAYIGVDWGFEDKAAVVGVVADKNNRTAYVVKDWSMSHKSISEICQAVVEMKKYIESNYELQKPIWIITDTNEKSASYELMTTYKLNNVFSAYKYDLEFAIEQLKDLLANNMICISNLAKSTIEDFENTLWERDEETDKIIHKIDDDIWHPNSAMALLYVSRQLCVDIFGLGEYNKTAKDLIMES